MQGTQLVCSHCGSSLSFQTPIPAGAAVECLICMRTFIASPTPAVPTEKGAKGKPAKAAKAAPTRPPVRPVPPRAEMPPAKGRGPVFLVACCLVLLAAIGVGAVAWRFLSNAEPDPDRIAEADPKGNPDTTPPEKQGSPPEKKKANPKLVDEDDEETRRIKELEKKKLVRKTPVNAEPEPEPIVVPNEEIKETYVGLNTKAVNGAIEKGIANLKTTQNAEGTWNGPHPVGHAALCGLTLLECKVPANDPAVQKAAKYVRTHVERLDFNYEVSLAVLFLDRLGDPSDRPRIQALALRILAGQNEYGAWDYHLPLLGPQDLYQLYAYLNTNHRINPVVAEAKKGPEPAAPAFREPGQLNDPFHQFQDLLTARPIKAGDPPLRIDQLKPNLQMLPVVRGLGLGKKQVIAGGGAGDNSNTQFSLLALWAARRYNIPTESAIVASFARFRGTQNDDGGWGYSAGSPSTRDTMACVGLLSLAMGHGVDPEVLKFNAENPRASVVKPALQDPQIQRGLKMIATQIGQPIAEGSTDSLVMPNLYFLWSVERVAMLYDLKTIDKKDWYAWGAQILVHRQAGDGGWSNALYPGATDPANVCFGLLFLRRSNLVQDLTNRLRLHSGLRTGD